MCKVRKTYYHREDIARALERLVADEVAKSIRRSLHGGLSHHIDEALKGYAPLRAYMRDIDNAKDGAEK